MSETEGIQAEDIQESETEKKLAKLGKYLLLSSIAILWIVVAALGIRDLWQGKGILETPWVIFGLVLTLVVIVFVVLPLLNNLREDIRDYNKRKEEKEKQNE
jgi:membrane protein YdbS with pleckstrin-like domain